MSREILAIALLASACLPVSAQWVDYRTAGIPRTPDGKPNLEAPAPKMADGKPDLSGVWGLQPEGRGKSPMFDLGKAIPGGLPLRPEAAALVAKRRPQDSSLRITEPKVNCVPLGPVFDNYDAGLSKIIQAPGVLVMLKEYNKMYRQVFLDGRKLEADPTPTYDGYSVGHWDGDTLVVETVGFYTKNNWLDETGYPISEDAKVTERYHRSDFGHMTVAITVDDSVNYSKPWTLTVNRVLKPDQEIEDWICADSMKDLQRMLKANGAGANK